MSDTNFTDHLTKVFSTWLQPINDWLYKGRNPNFASVTGTANALVLTLSSGSLYSAYADGDEFTFRASLTNTGPATLQVVGAATLTVGTIQLNQQALTGGEIVAGGLYRVQRYGTAWNLFNLQQLVDGQPVVVNSTDLTKKLRFLLSGLTTATTRVITAPDSNTTLPIISQVLTFTGPSAPRTYTLPDANLTIPAVTAKGDAYFASGSAVLAKVAAGSDNTLLGYDATQTAGVRAFSLGASLSAQLGVLFAIPRSFLSGLTLSTAGSSATFSVAAGQAVNSTNVALMNLAASINKTTSAWAVGTGNGSLDTGVIATSTWYHIYLIMRVDTGVVDVLISLSASAPSMPTGYTLKRRIGAMKTDGASQWTLFVQDGDYFRWSASVLDVDTTNPGVAAVSSTLTVPTGANVQAIFNGRVVDSTPQAVLVNFSDLAAADEAPSASAAPLSNLTSTAAGDAASAKFQVRTNTSAQIRYRASASGANTIVRVATLGWLDRRGQDA